MCGIISGICTTGNICPVLLGGLARLEYRGYDSAGIAVATTVSETGAAGDIARCVTLVRTAKLRQAAARLSGRMGIGHTRWATHGAPTEINAHPLTAGRVRLVHNGIIENHSELRRELIAAGRVFSSETDSEVIAHLLDMALAAHNDDWAAAWQQVRQRLQGAYAVCAMAEGSDTIFGARAGSPLLLGSGKNGFYIASDVAALAGVATRVRYIDNGNYMLLTRDGIALYDEQDNALSLALRPFDSRSMDVQLGEYTHFMQKEIFEQPDVITATMQKMKSVRQLVSSFGSGAAAVFRRAREISIVACGTSYHAGLIASYWMENFGIPCRVEIASEYRYRRHPLAAQSLAVFISQSGETADTLSALRAAKEAGATTIAIVNVETSSMVREADFVFYTRAGAEIGVASTKAFTAQLIALLLLTIALAQKRRLLPAEEVEAILHQLRQLPHLMRKALLLEEPLRRWGKALATATSALYIGRQRHYPLALEGALKIKEISYIHAEGCAAGELKHGLLALVDNDLPVIGIAPDDDLLAKTSANFAEVAARGGQLYVLAGQRFQLECVAEERIIRVSDDGGEYLSPMVYGILLQLLAYDTARQKGTDIDKPRNLAKSVTVE